MCEHKDSEGDWNRTNAFCLVSEGEESLCTGPKAAVFSFCTFEDRPLIQPEKTGVAARRLLYELLSISDKSFADALHGFQGLKPYTSSFWTRANGEPGAYEWRVVDLMGHLLPKLYHAAFPETGPRVFDAAGIPAKFDSIAVTNKKHPQAGILSWEQLLDVPECKDFTVHYLTPTRFRHKGGRVFNLFPHPLSVLHLAAAQWDAFSKENRFPVELIRNIASLTGVTDLYLKTRNVRGHGGVYHTGSVGRVRYQLQSGDPAYVLAFSILMPFLEYCGVGWATGAGMGRVRVERHCKY